jgi:SpoVK/Ycf46/Vps4 family AAA+-type ATPase
MQLWDNLVLERDRVLIMGASNRPQDVDVAVQRRFDRSFLLSLPDLACREDIFCKILEHLDKEPNFDFALCARLTEGYTSSDIANVCRAGRHALAAESRRLKDGQQDANIDSASSTAGNSTRVAMRPLRTAVSIYAVPDQDETQNN